jgi:hypothetical protein
MHRSSPSLAWPKSHSQDQVGTYSQSTQHLVGIADEVGCDLRQGSEAQGRIGRYCKQGED